jgi:photosystem II stability/assembly factor-like uncharacterized protein
VTTDGGATWRFRRVAGHERRDFRDVEAFSATRALVLAVASPGLILETEDGGATWHERFRDDRPEIFLDGLECAGERCLAFGDPIRGRFVVRASDDGGRSWRPIEGPEALEGEAAFAASGTSIRFADERRVAIGTGGAAVARVLLSDDAGVSWRAAELPLATGAPSRGVFSLLPVGETGWLAVGGDFQDAAARRGTAALSSDRGATWTAAEEPPGGYRSAVERLADGSLVASGPEGIDRSTDGGRRWLPLASPGFHAVRRARQGRLVLLAGADGRLARLAE